MAVHSPAARGGTSFSTRERDGKFQQESCWGTESGRQNRQTTSYGNLVPVILCQLALAGETAGQGFKTIFEAEAAEGIT